MELSMLSFFKRIFKMADRRKGSPWGMIQAIAASLALAVSL
ncbi:hypothetical protein SIPHO035v1_p0101 [Vibrio phage 234P7B]|nr:hypothetical protein SIPHO035v1_p0101 [Vibrio phage 234P7B]